MRREGERGSGITVPLSEADLDVLQWFGEWGPEVHRAHWVVKRRWPPGYRAYADLSVHDPRATEKAREERTEPPHPKTIHQRAHRLLSYRLLQGAHHVLRLTPRGRSALKLHGRPAPDHFDPLPEQGEVFDRVSLIAGPDTGWAPVDNPEAWAAALEEYRDDDYRGRHTLTGASAGLNRASSNGMFLNGSIREHHSFVILRVTTADHHTACEVALSLEGFADLLTANGSVPATLLQYTDRDGMTRAEPAPPPVSAERRMRERLTRAENRQEEVLKNLRSKVETWNLGVRIRNEIIHDLDTALHNGTANQAFVVTQAVEEVSQAVESIVTIAQERLNAMGVKPPAGIIAGVNRALAAGDDAREYEETAKRG